MIKLKSLLTEQTSEWDNVTTGTGGAKTVLKQFATSNQLTYPDFGELRLGEPFDKARPLYVGASLQVNYNPSAKFATGATNSNSSRFGYTLNVFLSTVKNTERGTAPNTNDEKSFSLFTINCAQGSDKKFLFIIQTPRNFAPAISRISSKTKTTGALNILATNMLFANIDGWFGTLRNSVNTELVKYGYPPIPNTTELSMTL